MKKKMHLQGRVQSVMTFKIGINKDETTWHYMFDVVQWETCSCLRVLNTSVSPDPDGPLAGTFRLLWDIQGMEAQVKWQPQDKTQGVPWLTLENQCQEER